MYIYIQILRSAGADGGEATASGRSADPFHAEQGAASVAGEMAIISPCWVFFFEYNSLNSIYGLPV